MKLIAHRGVPSLAPENSLRSILTAVRFSPAYIEFDIHATKDKRLVVQHDPLLHRTCNDDLEIKDLTYDEIKKIRTVEGEPIPSADEAISACGMINPAIEGKGAGWSEPLNNLLKNHFGISPIIISDNLTELSNFKNLNPLLATCLINRRNPFRVVSMASKNQHAGIGIVYWALNPFIYWRARQKGLKVIIYTVPPTLIKLFNFLYPSSYLATNYIQKFKRQT